MNSLVSSNGAEIDWSVMHLIHNLYFLGENYALMINFVVKEWVQFWYLNVQVCLLVETLVISVEEHASFVNIFVLLFVRIITVYLLKLFCTATFPLCDTIVLSRARHIWLTSIDASKWYWDGNSLYRKMMFPKCSAPVCSCIGQCSRAPKTALEGRGQRGRSIETSGKAKHLPASTSTWLSFCPQSG